MPAPAPQRFAALLALGATLLLAGCATGPRGNPSASRIPPTRRLPFQNGVRAILHDSAGRMWFASHNEGVCCLVGSELRWFQPSDGLSDGQVRRLHEGPDGRIWFECGKGLSYFDGERIHTPTERDYSASDAWRLSAGDLWFKSDAIVGNNEQEGAPGVYRLSGDTLSWLTFPVVTERGEDNYYSVTGYSRIGNERIWFATYGAVIGYDRAQGFTVLDDERVGRSEGSGYMHVRSVLEDREGRLWIGNNGIGVLLYEDGTVIDFSAEQGLGRDAYDQPGPLSRVFSIYQDRDGALWFGTVDQGAWRWDGEWMTQFGPAQGLESGHIWSFHTDRDGRLWAAGSTPSGAYWFDGERFRRGLR